MRVFFDTSVLVAAAVEAHPQHPASLAALRRVLRGSDLGWMAAHSLAEVFAVLTRLPLEPAIHPLEARRFLDESVVPHFEVLALTAVEYREVVAEAAEGGWSGGAIYDALLLKCAGKKPVDRILTLNLRHFQQIAPHWSERLRTP